MSYRTNRILMWTGILIALIGFTLAIYACPAKAATTEQRAYAMLTYFDSPLADEAYTVVAFWRAHPEFNIVDFYAIMWAESSLGKGTMKHCNVGSIKGGKVGTLWRDLRTGTYSGGYNHYNTFRDGQRSALRLILQHYNGSLLRGDNLHRYYGYDVAGWTAYRANVYAARALLLRAW